MENVDIKIFDERGPDRRTAHFYDSNKKYVRVLSLSVSDTAVKTEMLKDSWFRKTGEDIIRSGKVETGARLLLSTSNFHEGELITEYDLIGRVTTPNEKTLEEMIVELLKDKEVPQCENEIVKETKADPLDVLRALNSASRRGILLVIEDGSPKYQLAK